MSKTVFLLIPRSLAIPSVTAILISKHEHCRSQPMKGPWGPYMNP